MNGNTFPNAQIPNLFSRNRKSRRRAKAIRRNDHSGGSSHRYDPQLTQYIEPLEPRILLSSELPGLDPIDPGIGEANLLQLVDDLPINDIQEALDNYPIPYVVWAQKAGLDPVILNNHAGTPTRVDVDDNKATGKGGGGNDLILEVNTELLPTPHLVLSIERLGDPSKDVFVEDFSILIAFPFDAFTAELLPGPSNLFFGFQTTAADGTAGGTAGGIAPFSEVITFTPGTLAGTDHLFDVTLETTGDENPLTFFAGHFDGDIDSGVLNFDGLSAWVEDVPDTINIGLAVDENNLSTPQMFTEFGLEWQASNLDGSDARSLVAFSFVEDETAPAGGENTDYGTTVIVDKMPENESLFISMDESNPTFTLSHSADSVIDKLEFEKIREDGLIIRGAATDIPTMVDLTFEFEPSDPDAEQMVTLDVNANTLDLNLEVLRDGGIPGTSAFFGYDLGYGAVRVIDAPDLTATWHPDFDHFNVKATNMGEFIGMVEIVLDDDAHLGAVIDGMIDMDADGDVDGDDNGIVAGITVIAGALDIDGDGDIDGDDNGIAPWDSEVNILNGKLDLDGSGLVGMEDDLGALLVGLATPPSYFEGLGNVPGELHHIFSLVDDGTHGTAIGRINQVVEATLDVDADGSEVFQLKTAAPALPMQAYLRTLPTSTIVPDHDIEITCDIDDLPHGEFDIHFDGPGNFGYTTNPPQTIDSIHCFGHIDTLIFDIDAGDLPPVFDFEFEADSHVAIFAEDGFGGPDDIGHLAIRFWDEEGPVGIPNTAGLLGNSLRDARLRVDDIPSSHAQWTQVQTLTYDNGSGAAAPGVGAILYDSTTGATAEVLEAGTAVANGAMKIGFIKTQTGINDNDSLDLLDSLAVDGQTEDVAVGEVITGETSGATATVRRATQLGGAGTLYISDIAGAFLNNENLLVDGEVVAQANGTIQAAGDWAGQVNGALVGDGTVMDFNTNEDDVFLGGVQFKVSTEVELEDPLPEAAFDAPHFALLEEEIVDSELVQRLGGGAFGIDAFHLDTFSSLNLHYDANEAHLLDVDILRQFGGAFFGPDADFQMDLSLDINAIPQEFDFSTDLMTQYVYDASHPITSISLAGTVDDVNDGPADPLTDGTQVNFAMLGLPSEVRFGILAGELAIANGRLDVNGDGSANNADDGMLAGANFINGRMDVNNDGAIDGADDGSFFGIVIINGEFDVDASGTVDNNDDGGLAGVELNMNGGINQIGVKLESDTDIFDSGYRLIQANVDDVPAQFVLSYGDGRFFMDMRDELGNPDSLTEIEALVSTTNDAVDNAMKVLPFTLDGPVQGGTILADPTITGGDPGGSRINYSQFLQEIDERYYNEGVPDPSGVLTRLAELYADSEQLDFNEDHLLIRMGSGDTPDFASFQFNDFQHSSWTPDADGGRFIYRAPNRADESFFAGYEDAGTFTTIEIEHIPDEIDVDLDTSEHLTYTASTSPGEIDLYHGPGDATTGLFASDADDAVRAVIRNTPDEIRIFWDFGFPSGGAFMDASNEFELLFLTQDGDKRITAGLTLEDLHLGWGFDLFSFDVTDSIEIWNPFGDNLVIPTAWEIFEAKAGIDNDADGLTLANVGNTNEIGANDNKADVAGFFSMYDNIGSVSPLVDPAGPAPASNEYVPMISVMTEGFREFSMDFLVELDPLSTGELWPIDIEFNINTSKIGNLIFDFWSSAHTVFTDDDDIPFIPEVGFENPPDYTDNTPFHILPGIVPGNLGQTIINALKGIHTLHDWVITWDGFHAFGDHFDPFAGTPAPFTGSSGDGGFDGGDAGFLISALGPFSGALSRWQTALADSATYSDAQAADIINDIGNNTEIVVGSFGGAILGTASGNTSGATITIDPDAGGFEWFEDTSPFDDAEFTGGGPAPANLIAPGGSDADGKIDMVTFFEHEIGHILGFGHGDVGVMLSTLPRGVRRLPVADDVDPGAPPNPAPAGDDIGALMAESSLSPWISSPLFSGYVYLQNGSDRRRIASDNRLGTLAMGLADLTRAGQQANEALTALFGERTEIFSPTSFALTAQSADVPAPIGELSPYIAADSSPGQKIDWASGVPGVKAYTLSQIQDLPDQTTMNHSDSAGRSETRSGINELENSRTLRLTELDKEV